MMDPNKEVEVFARVAGDPRFEVWLAEQQADAMKYLVQATDPLVIHRAQGKILFIEMMTKLLAKGKSLR